MKVKTAQEVVEFLRPIAREVGVELVDAEWNMRDRSLTLHIDREGGIDLNACEKFHRAADPALDELDPTFGEAYTLNCSSLGLDRPFKNVADFERNMGEKIEIHLYAPYEGKKYYEGILLSFDGENVVIKDGKTEKSIPFAATSKVCLCIEV